MEARDERCARVTPSLRAINWSHVAANTLVLALFGVFALYFSTYQPHPFTEQERAASRAHNIAAPQYFSCFPIKSECDQFVAFARGQKYSVGSDHWR